MIVLWTDLCVYAFLGALALSVVIMLRKSHIRIQLHALMQRSDAMVTLTVLCAYALISLLDSIHMHIGAQHTLQSVLDISVSPLGTHYETTYSTPFATHLLTKATLLQPDGTYQHIHPALRHVRGGALLHPAAIACIKGLIAWALCFIATTLYHVRRTPSAWCAYVQKISTGKTPVAWRSFWVTLGILLLLGSLVLDFSGQYHILGTGKVGQDVLYQTLKSIRTGVLIGGVTLLIMLPFSIVLGITAGYCGGWIDDMIQYVYTTLSSVPSVLLISASVLSLNVFITKHSDYFPTLHQRADARLLALCVILGVTGWTPLCRLLRGESLKLREVGFVESAIALGVRPYRIMLRHILPNVMPIIVITVVLDFSSLVLAEAVLSYVGVGVGPTTISWGNMINGARLELARDPVVWWPLLAAFLLMFILVLSVNIFADALRDVFEPS